MGSSIFKLSLHLNRLWSQFAIMALTLLVASLPCLVLCTHFDVPAFSSMAEFFTLGDAHHVPENLSVNINSVVNPGNLEGRTTGRVLFTKELVRMRDRASGTLTSFSTSFTFSITQGEGTNRSGWQLRTSGFAFTFATENMSDVVGNCYRRDIYTHGIGARESLFAIEFDTFNNHFFNDPSDNHIGIDVKSVESIHTYNLCDGRADNCSFPWTGRLYTAWIEYNVASPLLLEMWLSNGSLANGITKPQEAIIRVPKLDLINIFEDYMYVGFVSDSGMYNDTHRILSWKFTSNFLEDMSLIPTRLSTSVILMISTILGVALLAILVSRHWWQRQHQLTIFKPDLNNLMGRQIFAYKELKKATKNFNENAILGTGGFGTVYKGTLQTPLGSTVVAIKRLRYVEFEHGKKTFLTEASTISQISHRNLVHLQGWCHEGKHFFLIFDYMSNGSLDEWLFTKRRRYPNNPKYKKFEVLPWILRSSILGGVAGALEYLHEDWVQCILHRDIKSSNVMLDDNMNPHLGDFGLARLMDHDKLEKTTLVAGTLSYMAPELPYTGKATKESDVYSFGILMLEVICSRQPLNLQADDSDEDIVLLESVWRAHEAGNVLSVVDPKLLILNSFEHIESPSSSSVSISEQSCGEANDCFKASSNVTSPKQSLKFAVDRKMMHLLHLGLMCCLPDPEARPSMRVVKQVIMQLHSTSETSTTMLNLMPHLPPRRPLGRYPLPGFDSQLNQDINNSSSQRRRHSHTRSTQSRLVTASIGHELP